MGRVKLSPPVAWGAAAQSLKEKPRTAWTKRGSETSGTPRSRGGGNFLRWAPGCHELGDPCLRRRNNESVQGHLWGKLGFAARGARMRKRTPMSLVGGRLDPTPICIICLDGSFTSQFFEN